jgi:hypothetical protein
VCILRMKRCKHICQLMKTCVFEAGGQRIWPSAFCLRAPSSMYNLVWPARNRGKSYMSPLSSCTTSLWSDWSQIYSRWRKMETRSATFCSSNTTLKLIVTDISCSPLAVCIVDSTRTPTLINCLVGSCTFFDTST